MSYSHIAYTTTNYFYKRWGFGESIAMEALLAAGGLYRDVADRLITSWAYEPQPLAADPLAHVAPGVPLLMLYQHTGDRHLLERAYELGELLANLTVGKHGARIHRPDLAGWQRTVWVDNMHLSGPFLARLGQQSGNEHWYEQAVNLLGHARVLQDRTSGLFSHGFDDETGQPNRVFWGRGQGWALLGLVDTLEYLPTAHPARHEIGQRLSALVAALAATEQNGRWHTVVDHPETYLEPSVSAFVALGLGRALRRGLANAAYQPLAERAGQATLAAITPAGALAEVSDATPVGWDAAHYNARGRGVFPWGQGPALLAALEQGL
jgi:unsaturated rhamnogalacturonyl hydrolase